MVDFNSFKKGVLVRLMFIFALAMFIFPSSANANEDPRLDIQNISMNGNTIYLDATISNVGDRGAHIYKISVYTLTIVDRRTGQVLWKGAPTFDNLNIYVSPNGMVNETLRINNVSVPHRSDALKWEFNYSIFTN